MIQFSTHFASGVNAFAATLGFGVCLLGMIMALALLLWFVGFISGAVGAGEDDDDQGDGME